MPAPQGPVVTKTLGDYQYEKYDLSGREPKRQLEGKNIPTKRRPHEACSDCDSADYHIRKHTVLHRRKQPPRQHRHSRDCYFDKVLDFSDESSDGYSEQSSYLCHHCERSEVSRRPNGVPKDNKPPQKHCDHRWDDEASTIKDEERFRRRRSFSRPQERPRRQVDKSRGNHKAPFRNESKYENEVSDYLSESSTVEPPRRRPAPRMKKSGAPHVVHESHPRKNKSEMIQRNTSARPHMKKPSGERNPRQKAQEESSEESYTGSGVSDYSAESYEVEDRYQRPVCTCRRPKVQEHRRYDDRERRRPIGQQNTNRRLRAASCGSDDMDYGNNVPRKCEERYRPGRGKSGRHETGREMR